jgi:hypothetical protein
VQWTAGFLKPEKRMPVWFSKETQGCQKWNNTQEQETQEDTREREE